MSRHNCSSWCNSFQSTSSCTVAIVYVLKESGIVWDSAVIGWKLKPLNILVRLHRAAVNLHLPLKKPEKRVSLLTIFISSNITSRLCRAAALFDILFRLFAEK